jgi:hypothetical protein
MAKAKVEQTEIPMEGPGVAPVKDKKLDKLCDMFIDLRDGRAKLAEELGATEVKILDRMTELGITVHRFGDQIAKIKPGKNHIKIKTVKADEPYNTDGFQGESPDGE